MGALVPSPLSAAWGTTEACAGRQGGKEQDDAHEPAAGVVCAVSGTPIAAQTNAATVAGRRRNLVRGPVATGCGAAFASDPSA